MIEITAEQSRLYDIGSHSLNGVERHLTAYLRDRTAEVMRLEFEKDHHLGFRQGWFWCEDCKYCASDDPNDERIQRRDGDPRHAYTWPDWQQAAHERLMGETK